MNPNTCADGRSPQERRRKEDGENVLKKKTKKQLKKFIFDENCKTTDPSVSKNPKYKKREGNHGRG